MTNREDLEDWSEAMLDLAEQEADAFERDQARHMAPFHNLFRCEHPDCVRDTEAASR